MARQSALLSEIRKRLTYAAEQSTDSAATLYVDIDGAVTIERGRPPKGPGSYSQEAIRVGVYGPFLQVAQVRDDIEQHLRDFKGKG